MGRGGSWTAATSKIEHFVIIVNGWKPLTINTKSSILNVAAVLDRLRWAPKEIKEINFWNIVISFFETFLLPMSSEKWYNGEKEK